MIAQTIVNYDTFSDLELAARIVARDRVAVGVVTQRNNQRLFRAAWSVLKNRAEAEDAVQSGYLKAFDAMTQFRGEASLSTWLTRIVINEALGRQRAEHRRRAQLDNSSIIKIEGYREKLMSGSVSDAPDSAVAREQVRRILEAAVARLPDDFRLVFVLREIEGLDVEEVSQTICVPAATVKTRHLRARRRLQQDLGPELRTTLQGVFPFAGADCEAMSARVLRAFTGAE